MVQRWHKLAAVHFLLILLSIMVSPFVSMIPDAHAATITYAYNDTNGDRLNIQSNNTVSPLNWNGVQYKGNLKTGTCTVTVTPVGGKNGTTGSVSVTFITINGQAGTTCGDYYENDRTTYQPDGNGGGTLTISSVSIQRLTTGGGGGTTGGGGGTNPAGDITVGQFTDHSHITVAGVAYVDSQTDDILNYKVAQPTNACDKENVIKDFKGSDGADPANATNYASITTYSNTATDTRCKPTTVQIRFDNHPEFNYFFVWNDAGNISSSDWDNMVFTRTTASGAMLSSGGSQYDSECKSEITPNSDDPSAEGSTGTLIVRYSGTSSPFRDGWPKDRQSEYNGNIRQTGTQADGCKVSAPILVALGHTENAKKPIGSSGVGTTGKGTQRCDGGVLGWILCPIIEIAAKTYTSLSGIVQNFLKTDALNSTNYRGAYAIWQNLRNIADVLFVLIFLVMIFSTTTSIGVDNYTVKKVLPRLVVAVILVQFSWFLMQFAFDVTTILAAGIQGIVNTATSGASSGPTGNDPIQTAIGVFGIGTAAVVGAALAIAFIVPFLLMIFSAMIGILTVFITLQIRKFILIALVVMAPVAIVAWVLPNTNSLFRTWWKLLFRLLMMYPLIVLIFALSRVSGLITSGATGNFAQLIAAAMPIIAFYSVPWTFKWAGSAMNTAANLIASRTSGINKGVRGSQAVKDLKQGQKERQLLNTENARTPFGRGIARLGAGGVGGFMGGKAATRRMGDARKKLETARASEAYNQLKDSRFGDDQIFNNTEHLESISKGNAKSVGLSDSPELRMAAMKRMIEMKDSDGLRRVKESGEGQKLWTKFQDENYTDLKSINPALVAKTAADEAKAFAGMAPTTLESLDAGGVDDFMRWAASDPNQAQAILDRYAASPNAGNNLKGGTLSSLKGLSATIGGGGAFDNKFGAATNGEHAASHHVMTTPRGTPPNSPARPPSAPGTVATPRPLIAPPGNVPPTPPYTPGSPGGGAPTGGPGPGAPLVTPPAPAGPPPIVPPIVQPPPPAQPPPLVQPPPPAQPPPPVPPI